MFSYYFHKSIQYLLYIINRFCLYTGRNNAQTNRCIQEKEPKRAAQQNHNCTGMPQRVLTRIKTTNVQVCLKEF